MTKFFSLDPKIARLIAQQRKPKTRRCLECGTEFTTVGRGLYCSPAHRVKAARRRANKPTTEEFQPEVEA